MARAKTKVAKSKIKETASAEEHVEETEGGDVEAFPVKSKKGPVVVLDEHVEVEVHEDKPEEEVPVKVEEEEELLTDEVTLDDEELNPFGDKWEE